MELIPKSRQHHAIQHSHHAWATGVAATVMITAKGTGLSIVPVWYRYQSSAAGSITLFAGSGGASVMHARVVTAGDERSGPWWDPSGVGSNTDLEIIKELGIGKGEFDMWYVIIRVGAGAGGNTL